LYVNIQVDTIIEREVDVCIIIFINNKYFIRTLKCHGNDTSCSNLCICQLRFLSSYRVYIFILKVSRFSLYLIFKYCHHSEGFYIRFTFKAINKFTLQLKLFLRFKYFKIILFPCCYNCLYTFDII
jgi:hypothetical protein